MISALNESKEKWVEVLGARVVIAGMDRIGLDLTGLVWVEKRG